MCAPSGVSIEVCKVVRGHGSGVIEEEIARGVIKWLNQKNGTGRVICVAGWMS